MHSEEESTVAGAARVPIVVERKKNIIRLREAHHRIRHLVS